MKSAEIYEKYKKACEKVDKCRGVIEKHKRIKNNKGIKIQKLGINPECDPNSYRNSADIFWLLCEYRDKDDDIAGAIRKLDEAIKIANNWDIKYKDALNKEGVIKNEVPRVIIKFMEDWKVAAINWHLNKVQEYLNFCKQYKVEYGKAVIECISTHSEYKKYRSLDGGVMDNVAYSAIRPREPLETYLKQRGLDYDSRSKKGKSFGPVAVLAASYTMQERLNYITNIVEREKQAKILDLVNRIKEVVGDITDAQYLNIGLSGGLEGIIIGNKGKVRIETVGAGGYNIQCYHFRTLVHKIQ